VDLSGHVSLVRAAQAAGVEHFVYTSISSEATPHAVLVRYKRRVERVIRESGMAWTVLQPAAFMETMFKPSAGWDIDQGRVQIVGRGTARFNPVSRDDVAEFATLCVVREDLQRRVIPVGGPDVVTALEVVALFEELSGRQMTVKHLSAARCGLTARILRPFKPVLSSIYALAAGNARDNVIDMALVLSEIPVGLTTIRQFALEQLSS
jgi:NADH dehydrogenase